MRIPRRMLSIPVQGDVCLNGLHYQPMSVTKGTLMSV